MLLSARGQATACPDCAHSLPTCPPPPTCMIRTLQEGKLSQTQRTLTTCSPQGPRALALLPPWVGGIIGARAGEERKDYV